MLGEMGVTARRCIALGFLCLVAGPLDVAVAGRLDSQSGDVARRTARIPAPPVARIERRAAAPAARRRSGGSRVAVPPIESPEYYDYQPEPLVAVDFSRLKAASQSAASEPE